MNASPARTFPGNASAVDQFMRPAYWLVFGLDWPANRAGGMAEAAAAVAPPMISRDSLSYDAYQILGTADLYAAKYKYQVFFFTDLTRLFTTAETSWAEMGIGWQAALAELAGSHHPVLYLTISERAYLVLCDPAAQHSTPAPGNRLAESRHPDADRELLRRALARQLSADWPDYMKSQLDAGRLYAAG